MLMMSFDGTFGWRRIVYCYMNVQVAAACTAVNKVLVILHFLFWKECAIVKYNLEH